MLPLLVAAALAIPFLHHRHHSSAPLVKPIAAVQALLAPPVPAPTAPAKEVPTVRIGDPSRQELEQTPGG